MKILIKKSHFAVAAISALLVTACGVGGGLAGIGGSGYISNGSITSFGSVFVNGVKFETDASTFDIEDDTDKTQDDLRIGMVVEVTGSINPDGKTGTATHIKYGDDLQGAVSNIVAGIGTTQFTILGNDVVASEVSTNFEGMLFANIAPGIVLEVSGFYDQNSVLQASYIKFKSASSNADTILEIKGTISDLSGNTFQIQNTEVNATTAIFEDIPSNQLQNGMFVEVKGKLSNNILIATSIEKEDGFSEEAGVELEGIITRYVDNTNFDVNGQLVDATNASLSPAGLILEEGIKIEVEGQLSNNVFIASEIEAREGEASVSAKVSEKFIGTNRFTVEVAGQFVSVQLTTATRLIDETGANDILLISELETGNFVTVQGFESASDTITATEVKREAEVKETELQGVVTAETVSSFTVLGVTYNVDPNTEYNDNTVETIEDFQKLTELGVTIIGISDEAPEDGIADEVEIED